jgi:hypothetical protein
MRLRMLGRALTGIAAILGISSDTALGRLNCARRAIDRIGDSEAIERAK